MKVIHNHADHPFELPGRVVVPAATTEREAGGYGVRTLGVLVVSDELLAELQAHRIARSWFGPAWLTVHDVAEAT